MGMQLRGPRPWPEGDEQQAQVWLMIEQALTLLETAKARSAQKETEVPAFEPPVHGDPSGQRSESIHPAAQGPGSRSG